MAWGFIQIACGLVLLIAGLAFQQGWRAIIGLIFIVWGVMSLSKASAEEGKKQDEGLPCEPMPDDTRERQWIEEHKHEYAGQWVALDGDRLIAASPIQEEVWDAVVVDGATLPLVHHIPSPDDLGI